ALLEHQFAAFVADEGRADLPFDLVERIDARFREEARERQSRNGWGRPRFRPPFDGLRPFRIGRTRLLRLDKRRRRRGSTAALNRLLTCGPVGSALFHVSAPFTPSVP